MPTTQPTTTSEPPTERPTSQLSDTDLASLPHFNNAPLSPSIIQSGLTIDEVNYSISLTSRSHQGQLYQPDYSSQPELYGVENAVPLAASLGTEQASAVWSLNQAQANLACRGLWRISLMKYIYDLLQTCIVPRCCVLSGWLPPDVFQAWQSETLQRRLWGGRFTRNAKGSLSAPYNKQQRRVVSCLLIDESKFKALLSQAISYSCSKEIHSSHGNNTGADDIGAL